jgi:type III secretion protein Q
LLAQDRDLASLKIRVAFQAGQIEMTAGELQELAPGALILVDRSPDDMFDIIANGKRIGTGELVKVGDKLAVRVTKLGSDV